MRVFSIIITSVLLAFSTTGMGQDFNFEKKKVALYGFDTTDYCCIKTKTAEIFFQKENFARKLNDEILKKIIIRHSKPVICIGEQLDTGCKSEINTLINQSSLPHLHQKITELILTENCMIRLKNRAEFADEILAIIHFRNISFRLREVIFIDSISQEVIHSSLIPK